MITDIPPQQHALAEEAEWDIMEPPAAKRAKAALPPLPSCEDHPRRELELYCRICQTAICSTCKEAEHSQCQKRWDEKMANAGLTQGSVFEGVERAARGLKEEVLQGLCNDSSQKEQALCEAAMAVAKRRTEIETQLVVRKKEVDTIEQALIKAVSQRCNELRSTLEAAAAEKNAALEKQGAGQEKRAESLQGARQGAEQTLGSLVVEERPLEAIGACLRLKRELAAISEESHASAPVHEANLHTAFGTLDELLHEVEHFGWSGALEADPAQCALSKQGYELALGPAGCFDVHLTTRNRLGQELDAGGLDVKAVVEPEGSVDGGVDVGDLGDGTYVISFQAKQDTWHSAASPLALRVEVCGSPIPGSPFAIASFPSSIVTTQEGFTALRSFLPGKKLQLWYRASMDGWSAADFHRLCDGYGATLVVAKEETNGYIFGGYTTVAWGLSQREMEDPQAFLFSLKSPSLPAPIKMPWRANSLYSAVYHDPNSGPMFGKHGDLTLLVNGRPQCGFSNLGRAYAAPAGLEQPGKFLAGSCDFRLSEMEVFLVE